MFWSEDSDDNSQFVIPDDIVDIVYQVKECKCLPIEHAHDLYQGLREVLPWIEEDERVGIHPIYGAETGNGWQRPDNPDELMYLSRRQKMTLRIPKDKLEEAQALTGQLINVGEHCLTVGESTIKLLSDMPVVQAKNVVADKGMDENAFLSQMAQDLKQMGINVKKMMCSIEREIRTPGGPIHTRGLMLADLVPEDSIKLQEMGLGEHRKLGCGLFLPQKGIKAVKPD